MLLSLHSAELSHSQTVSQLYARETSDIISQIATTQFIPNNEGVPGRTAGGGSRDFGWCPSYSPHHGVELVPLVAAHAQNVTTKARPSFLVHITNQSVEQLVLIVKDQEGEYNYETTVPIVEESGVIQISLPEDAPPLDVGKTYEWGVAVACRSSLRPDDPFISGHIRRISAPDMSRTPLVDQLAWHAEHHVWYDTISILGELKMTRSEDIELAASWTHILSDVGFAELASAPLLF